MSCCCKIPSLADSEDARGHMGSCLEWESREGLSNWAPQPESPREADNHQMSLEANPFPFEPQIRQSLMDLWLQPSKAPNEATTRLGATGTGRQPVHWVSWECAVLLLCRNRWLIQKGREESPTRPPVLREAEGEGRGGSKVRPGWVVQE